jgi:hypothetical protein
MTAFSAYGTSTCTPAELAQLVAARLDLTFVERESDYGGTYLVAQASSHRIEIQPNVLL